MKKLVGLLALSTINFTPLFSQEHEPGGPPPVLQITREAIKHGKSCAHEKSGMEFVRAFRKASIPATTLGSTRCQAQRTPGSSILIPPLPSRSNFGSSSTRNR